MAAGLLVVVLTIMASVAARYDYVKYGRCLEGETDVSGEDDGVFPSNYGNLPVDCYQPPQRGPCHDAYVNYYFDFVRRMCMPMIYSGCGGNSNLFATKEECINACEKKRSI